MERTIHTLFKDIKSEPDPSLAEDIWRTISTREARASKIKSWSYALVGVLSLVWLVVGVRDLLAQFTQSGFYEYLSLAFSDGGSIAAYWREFALTLADALPVTSLMFCLLAVVILFISIRQGMKQFRNQLSLA